MSLINNFRSFFASPTTQATQVAPQTPVKAAATTGINNPFLGKSSNYGKNSPVPGGFYAGQLNGQPNFVGRKLYVEI